MSAKKPSQRTNRTRPDDTLNLTPMIDMITCLMFFLLMFASVLPVVIIDAPLPKVASTGEEVRKAKEAPNKQEILVYLDPQGIRVRSDIGGEKSFAVTNEGKWPMGDIHQFLVQLKAKSPDSKEITLMPSDNTPYSMMVEIMDSARDLQKNDPGYRDVPIDLQGKPESEQFNRLFPDVSIGGV